MRLGKIRSNYMLKACTVIDREVKNLSKAMPSIHKNLEYAKIKRLTVFFTKTFTYNILK